MPHSLVRMSLAAGSAITVMAGKPDERACPACNQPLGIGCSFSLRTWQGWVMRFTDRLGQAQKIVIVIALGTAFGAVGSYLVNLGNAARAGLCVPKTSSTSCDQAIFVNQATDASLSSDAVLVEIDWSG
jgi:hypothetical protein